MSGRRRRVLLLAEACNPEWFSVPLVGWSHSQALARLCDVHLVTQVRNRPALERAGLVHGRDFTAIDTEPFIRPALQFARLLRGGTQTGWTIASAMAALAYPAFEHLVWKQFGRRIRAGEFDLVHRLIPLSPTTSSSVARRCAEAGVPFVLGPLNGGLPWPTEFRKALWQEKEWLSYVRSAYKLLPGYRSTRQYASAILIASQATWDQMPRRYRHKCFYIPENGIDPQRFPPRPPRMPSRPLRAAFVGRLVPYKGADMLMEAAAPLVKAGKLHLTIVGDGPQMPLLRQIVQREGIEQGVSLPGWVEHTKVQQFLADAHVFAFPSIREFGGGVVLEAMAQGLVPIIVDYGGPGELVTPRTGYKVPLSDRAGIIAAFRKVLGALAENPRPLEEKARLALRRVFEQLTWDAKAKQVVEVYDWVLDPTRPRPQLVCPVPEPSMEDSKEQQENVCSR